MQDLSRWNNKVALVTGATGGIGEAVAYALAGVGMTVAVSGRRREKLETVANAIQDRGGKALAVPCDLEDETSLLAMFDRIAETVGPLDVLVNNAGFGLGGSIENLSTRDLQHSLNVNVVGSSICIREAMKHFQHRQDTALIGISSLAAHRVPTGGYGCYAASKHALRVIMDSLRAELVVAGSPTKVGSISPGTVDTEFHKLFARGGTDPTANFQFDKLQPQDIADAVLYMLGTPRHVQINDILMRPVGQIG